MATRKDYEAVASAVRKSLYLNHYLSERGVVDSTQRLERDLAIASVVENLADAFSGTARFNSTTFKDAAFRDYAVWCNTGHYPHTGACSL